ncbi:uncharacterized protein [Triticum aestivum]|uniref:uncharacterized protein isoform X1 n=1 Tax=Triticum aestivum TaxID=4565 RepID=UPI001D003EA8|nr:uncharacterized protein LOC123100431 isoform X1 [Triticum aestivum]
MPPPSSMPRSLMVDGDHGGGLASPEKHKSREDTGHGFLCVSSQGGRWAAQEAEPRLVVAVQGRSQAQDQGVRPQQQERRLCLVPGSMDSLQKKKLGSTMDGKTHHLLPWSDHGQEDVVRTRSPVLSGELVLGRSSTPSFLLSPMIFRYTLGHYHMPCIQFEASRSHDIDGIHQSWILRHLDGP